MHSRCCDVFSCGLFGRWNYKKVTSSKTYCKNPKKYFVVDGKGALIQFTKEGVELLKFYVGEKFAGSGVIQRLLNKYKQKRILLAKLFEIIIAAHGINNEKEYLPVNHQEEARQLIKKRLNNFIFGFLCEENNLEKETGKILPFLYAIDVVVKQGYKVILQKQEQRMSRHIEPCQLTYIIQDIIAKIEKTELIYASNSIIENLTAELNKLVTLKLLKNEQARVYLLQLKQSMQQLRGDLVMATKLVDCC